MTLLGLLVALLIVAVIVWATRALLGAFSVPDPIRTVVFIIVVLICVLYLLGGYVGGIPTLRLR